MPRLRAGHIGPIRREIIFEPLPDAVPAEPAPGGASSGESRDAARGAGPRAGMSELAKAFGGGDHGRQLVPGSLRGYRSWRRIGRRAHVPSRHAAVGRDHPSFRAVGADAPRGVHRTRARQPEPARRPPDAHRSPAPSCECGIYAWYVPDDTMAMDAGFFGAFGVIQASGLVLMGDRGFRAERAQIIAVVTWNKRVAAACAEAGIAVYRRRRDLLRDYPPEDLSALLGHDVPARVRRTLTGGIEPRPRPRAVLHGVGARGIRCHRRGRPPRRRGRRHRGGGRARRCSS